MNDFRFRQVHLDFHTTELIDGVGSCFSKEQFQDALKLGHVDSVTLFSKCHHGWSYHPTKANVMHPTLTFDLLGAQIEACNNSVNPGGNTSLCQHGTHYADHPRSVYLFCFGQL